MITMGIPDRTVDHSANYDANVFETIIEESAKLNMNDMEVWRAWRLGVAAFNEMRKLEREWKRLPDGEWQRLPDLTETDTQQPPASDKRKPLDLG